jgi:hypothetical protein
MDGYTTKMLALFYTLTRSHKHELAQLLFDNCKLLDGPGKPEYLGVVEGLLRKIRGDGRQLYAVILCDTFNLYGQSDAKNALHRIRRIDSADYFYSLACDTAENNRRFNGKTGQVDRVSFYIASPDLALPYQG